MGSFPPPPRLLLSKTWWGNGANWVAERKYDGYQLFAHSPNFIPLTIYTIDGIREACAQRLWFHAGAPALPHNTSTRTARATDPLASMSTVAHADASTDSTLQAAGASSAQHPRRPGGRQAPTLILITYTPDAKLGCR